MLDLIEIVEIVILDKEMVEEKVIVLIYCIVIVLLLFINLLNILFLIWMVF